MRKRTFILLLLPVFIILWIIGWTLLIIGEQKSSSSKTPKENVTIMAVLHEEVEELITT